ncbi:MAG: hypothetical protein WC365_06265 [Candidatus Babeliales bacterium]|jgi:HPt (histidine-containing phosphotransfer) domain-containing protein
MFKMHKKPENDIKKPQLPANMVNKATDKEMIQFLLSRTEKQDEKLDDISERLAKLQQQLADELAHSAKVEAKSIASQRVHNDNRKWIVGITVSVVFSVISVAFTIWSLTH